MLETFSNLLQKFDSGNVLIPEMTAQKGRVVQASASSNCGGAVSASVSVSVAVTVVGPSHPAYAFCSSIIT
jgi:hypothetical protein